MDCEMNVCGMGTIRFVHSAHMIVYRRLHAPSALLFTCYSQSFMKPGSAR